MALLLDTLLDLIAPTRCAGCELPGAVLCDRCRAACASIDPRWACPRCGAPYGFLTCTECWDRELRFESAVALGVLERPISRAVTLYKDANERRLAAEFGRLLAVALEPWAGWGECVVPIPASRAAIRRRGFDHAELLATALAAELGLPCTRALVHLRALDQRGLSRLQRGANAAGSLAPAPGVRVPDRAILVDDVLTTGATLDAAASVLLGIGALEVRAAVLARAW